MFDATTLINDAIILAGIFGLNKSGLFKFVQKNEGAIVSGVERVGEGLAELVQLPGAKIVEAELHHKVDDLTKQFRESEIGRLAAVALNYTAKDWGELSPTQQDALCIHLDAVLPKEWNVSRAEIEKAFEAVQNAADKVAENTMIQTADKFTAESQAAQSKAAEAAAAQEQTQSPA